MKAMKSAAGAALAALYAAAFGAAYVDYLHRAGQWFADIWLALAALPFTLTEAQIEWLGCGGRTLVIVGALNAAQIYTPTAWAKVQRRTRRAAR